MMQSHGPKRIYTPHSLEFWFGKLEDDWAAAFSEKQLELGRQIYVGGEVRELELTDKDAIVHRRVEKKDEYAVIEWTAEGLSVRSSSTDRELAHALAVAGLHEIEELVADEISPLPADVKSEAAETAPATPADSAAPLAKSGSRMIQVPTLGGKVRAVSATPVASRSSSHLHGIGHGTVSFGGGMARKNTFGGGMAAAGGWASSATFPPPPA